MFVNDCPCGTRCRGLTTWPLYVGPSRINKSLLNKLFVSSIEWRIVFRYHVEMYIDSALIYVAM